MAELISSPGKSGSRLGKMPIRVDLTAMVDLAFLLITFFILTTTLEKPKAIPLTMPAPGPSGPVALSSTMTICLGNKNEAMCYMGMPEKPLNAPKLVNYDAGLNNFLIQTAKHINASGKRMFVIIKPSDHSVYKNLVATLDAMNINSVPSYAIAKITPVDIGLLKDRGIY